MKSEQVLENFDSLWFFATVFSERTPPLAVEKLQNSTKKDAVDSIGEEIATPVSQNQENVDEKRIEDCNGLGSEMKTEEKRKSRIRRRSCCWIQRRKIVGEMDVSNAVNAICECWVFEERIGNGDYCQMKNIKKMASFEDNMAMKEHIRSWAYAVACAVR